MDRKMIGRQRRAFPWRKVLVGLAFVGTLVGLDFAFWYATRAEGPAVVEVEVPAPGDPKFDVGTIPTAFSSFGSIGHICPIAERRALTARHVATVESVFGLEPDPFVWSDAYGHSGPVKFVMMSKSRDLAVVDAHESGDAFAYVFPISSARADVGEKVYLAGYDFENHAAQRLVEATIIRNRGGIVYYTPSGRPGSSGSCVLRADGSVVAINVAEFGADTGVGVSVVGAWGVE
jgi:hypothetical protein